MSTLMRVSLVVLAIGLAGGAGYALGRQQSGGTERADVSSAPDNEELRRMYEDDQADRATPDPKTIDSAVVAPRDRARRERVKALLAEGRLITGSDYYHAGMILQHGEAPEDYLLAHDLAVAAIAKGYDGAGQLAAAAEDRFLINIGRSQRFGTQFTIDGVPWRLIEPIDPAVTDELRQAIGAHSLAAMRAKIAELSTAR